jgi:hypothetical protein
MAFVLSNVGAMRKVVTRIGCQAQSAVQQNDGNNASIAAQNLPLCELMIPQKVFTVKSFRRIISLKNHFLEESFP